MLALALGLLGGVGAIVRAAGPAPVLVGRIEGAINPVTARYVERVITAGEERGAAAVVFTMDTPGGLIDATYRITGSFLNARVPIVVLVEPPGARAASAGTFITLAAHVAAMAPATNIGAAHPVDGSGRDMEGDLRAKAENDAVAQITKIALARSRNIEWAESAVRKSVSIRDDEALKIGVVDVVVRDVAELLDRIDGRDVRLPQGTVRLATRGAPIEDEAMGPLENFLHLITDPQIAVLLFTIGTYGVIFELSNPSLIFPGIVGVICIVLGLFALGTLDANAAGLALMVFAVVLFLAEIKIASHGLLTIGGVVALAIGTIILFPPLRPTFPGVRYTVDPLVIVTTVGMSAAFFLIVARASFGYRTLPVASGSELLLGAVGVARGDLAPTGIVHVADDDWTGVATSGSIPKGTRIRVLRVDGTRLIVEPDASPAEGRVS